MLFEKIVMLENIRVVLVNTSHPGNIGAAARAMKTMGLTTLYLVSPELFPHPKAIEMAVSAADIVDNAIVVADLKAAIADCNLVVGTSARSRTIPWPMLSPREFAEKAISEASTSKVAVIFGRERSGLTNDELHHCHFHLQIPSDPAYSSLNMAAAVQVIAYELYMASLTENPNAEWDYPLATVAEMQGFYEHLERTLVNMSFLDPQVPRQLMTRLQRLFNRARPDIMEVNILRGILGAIEKKL
jgi:tRNA (cytidine32/uridine32-2'-O)-methyltransferase